MAGAEPAMAERAHLSIGEVLSLVQEDFPDITISKIRFLESQGLLEPERTPSGYRKFYDSDIERLQWILTQQRDHFLPLKVIRERLDEWDATGTVPADGDAASTEATTHRDAGDAAPEPSSDETDPRHAAASLAAASAMEVAQRPPAQPSTASDAEHADGAAMDAGSTGAGAASAGDEAGLRVGPTSTSLTAEELAGRAGVPVSVVHELESYSMIESRRIGPESYFEPDAIVVAEACRVFLDHGIEVRHLRMYKIAAEREAGVFEQLVMPLLKQRNPDARARASETVRTLAEVGQELHAALLRNALSHTLP